MKQQMSEEQIRVKVAELCGWFNVHVNEVWALKHDRYAHYPYLVGISPTVQTLSRGTETTLDCNHWTIPNYPRDLNACAEMEGTLGSKYGLFHDELLNITPTPAVMSSSALQRCLAFLAVHGIDVSLSK